MSIACSQKEFILSIYLMKHKEVLESVLGLEIEQIELEKSSGGTRVDLYGINPIRKLEVFVENQVTPSDEKHLNENLFNLIYGCQEGIIVWIAKSFKMEHLHKVKSFLVRNRKKFVNFYAFELNEEAIMQIEQLNRGHKHEVIARLNQVHQVNGPVLKRVFKHEQMPSTHIGKVVLGERRYDFRRIEDVKDFALDTLRAQVPNYMNLFRQKKHNEHDFILSIGAGKSDIYYRLSVKNREGLAFVEIYFQNKLEIFNKLVNQYHEMRSCVDQELTIGKQRIGVYFKPYAEIKDTVIKIGEILQRLIEYCSPQLYVS